MAPKEKKKANGKRTSDREVLAAKKDGGKDTDDDRKKSSGSPKDTITTLAPGVMQPTIDSTERSAKRPKVVILICGRCDGKNGIGGVAWVQLPNENGVLIDMGNACLKCWRAFIWGWRVLGYEWTWVCARCKEDMVGSR